jgi:hypothetical protein
MRRYQFVTEDLEEAYRRLLLYLLNSSMQFPFNRVTLSGRLDYEFLIRTRMYRDGERGHVSGLCTPVASHASWQRMNGYRIGAGVFIHVVPSSGTAGILLPDGACPVYAGPYGLAWDGNCSEGLVMFRRNVIPRGGQVLGNLPDISVNEHLGFATAMMLFAGELPEFHFHVPCSGLSEARKLCDRLSMTAAVNDAVYDGMGVTFRPHAAVYSIFRQMTMGNILDKLLWYGGGFWDGVREALSLARRRRTTGMRLAGCMIRMLWRAGAGHSMKVLAGEDIALSLAPAGASAGLPLPNGRTVKHGELRRARASGMYGEWFHKVGSRDIVWKKCRIGKVILSARSVFPTSEAFTIHPSGLVYALAPGEPFMNQVP